MSYMGTRELLEFEKELKDLMERSNDGAVIVVEGFRDRESLRLLGIRGRIVESSSSPSDILAEEICRITKDVIIFTDSDRSGISLQRRLVRAFECRGIKPDVKTGKKMLSLCKVNNVELLALRYYKSLEFVKF
ncbi:MAG: hypothetical protein DSY33_03165 [Archaeoglobus sp.]|jgi:5S rRNA maturation endonuclease (ribonuclease M5)|nr:MAG: hypothetical protein DSY33_03165 [Archaeoglobus sp.]